MKFKTFYLDKSGRKTKLHSLKYKRLVITLDDKVFYKSRLHKGWRKFKKIKKAPLQKYQTSFLISIPEWKKMMLRKYKTKSKKIFDRTLIKRKFFDTRTEYFLDSVKDYNKLHNRGFWYFYTIRNVFTKGKWITLNYILYHSWLFMQPEYALNLKDTLVDKGIAYYKRKGYEEYIFEGFTTDYIDKRKVEALVSNTTI